MKRIILITFIAAISSTAQAQTQAASAADVDNAVRISAPHPQNIIELPGKPHHLFAGDFNVYRGTYDLSNGGELMLKQRGRRIYATLTGGEEKELVAAAHNVFVAKDRNLKITLHDNFNREVTGEVLIRRQRSVADIGAGREAPIERLAVR